jgi:hypothetical protein
METTRPGRSIPAWVILVVLAIVVATMLVLSNWWTDRRSDGEIGRVVDGLEQELCPPSDPC